MIAAPVCSQTALTAPVANLRMSAKHPAVSYEEFRFGGFPIVNVAATNSAGEIVGNFSNGSSFETGFLRRAGGKPLNFKINGAAFTQPLGVNATGEIVGSY